MDKQTSSLSKYYSELSTDTALILDEFTKPIQLNVFFNNKEYLVNESELVLFDKDRWKLRPYVFCNDYYKNQHFYPVILLVNGLSSMFEFLPDNFDSRYIFVPPRASILKILSLTINTEEVE